MNSLCLIFLCLYDFIERLTYGTSVGVGLLSLGIVGRDGAVGIASHHPVVVTSDLGVDVDSIKDFALSTWDVSGLIEAITPTAMRNVKAMITVMTFCWLVSFMIQILPSFSG